MPASFGDHLRLFALSIDVVDEARLNRVGGLIENYCKETLGIDSVKLLTAEEVDGRAGLRRRNLSRHEQVESSYALKSPSGEYQSQAAYGFANDRKVWIVSATGKQHLASSSAFRDLWNPRYRKIPAYRKVAREGSESDLAAMTAIALPVRHGIRRLGVLSLETREYLEITEEAKSELEKIADALGILLRLRSSAQTRDDTTELAVRTLEEFLRTPQARLTKPKIFLASSHDGPGEVVDAIRAVLKEYGDRLELVFWKDMDQPGNITLNLLRQIGSCRYALCYFSQALDEEGRAALARLMAGGPTDDQGEAPAGHPFMDNLNVIFEAGMFHGRMDEMRGQPSSWIPIRERDSPPLPFDFAQERILWVERTKSGSLDEKRFKASLRRSLEGLLALD